MYNLATYDSELVLCPEAAVTNCCKLGGRKQSKFILTALEAGRCHSSHFLLEGLGESLSVASLQLLGVAETLSCTHTPPSSAFVSTAFSLTVCVSVSRRLSPYKDEGPSSSRMTSAQLDCICRDPVSKEGHSHRFWVDMIVGRIVHNQGRCS